MRKTTLLALSLSLAAWATDTGRFDRLCSRAETGRTMRGQQCEGVPTFEFATANGVGMPSTCDCITYPAGTKGEPISFTRGSAAVCTLGNVSSSIANGDLIQCGFNQTRIMPGGDGTGGNGVLLEPAATNLAIQSEDFTTSWTTFSSGGPAAPTVTADYGVAPDNNSTADRLQLPDCAAANAQSIIYQSISSASTAVDSLFIKSNSGTKAISVCIYGTVPNCTACTVNATTWTRCANLALGDLQSMVIGCNNNAAQYAGFSNTGAADLLVWGAQAEATTGGVPSSYIRTTTVAATRATEENKFSVSVTLPTFGDGWSMALTSVMTAAPLNGYFQFLQPSSLWSLDSASAGTRYAVITESGVFNHSASPVQSLSAGSNRFAFQHLTSTSGRLCLNGACSTLPAPALTAANPSGSSVGFGLAIKAPGFVAKSICLDATRSGKCL